MPERERHEPMLWWGQWDMPPPYSDNGRDKWTKHGRPRGGWRYHRPDVEKRRKQQKASKQARRANRGRG